MTWNKLLSTAVRVHIFPFFLFKYIVLFVLFFIFYIVKSVEEALSVMFNAQIYNTDWTLSLPLHVNGSLLIHEINEIAQETKCFTWPCHSTKCRFDFTNIIIEKEICWGSNSRLLDRKQCSLTLRPSRHCPISCSYWIL